MKNLPEIYMYVLGALITIGFFVLLGLLIFKGVPDENKEVLYLVIGALISSFTGVVQFFFGSSKGSKDKTKHLIKQSENKALG